MILPPGSSVHSYELTSSDVIKILSSDVFIFTGGESQSYISELLKNNDFDACVFSLLDNAPVKLKEESEGIINVHEEEASYDEHVWTSLENEKALVSSFSSLLASIDEDNASFYAENAREYNNEIEKLEEEIRDLVSSSLRKEIVVADRFPLLYFFTEFGLSWYAAYPGCAEETEVNAKTVSLLIDIIRERNIPFVVHMELSSQLLSDAISEETGCSVLTFNSVHTISKEDFEAGETYISLMRRNIETLLNGRAKFIMNDSENDQVKQNDQVDAAIQRNVDALAINLVDPSSASFMMWKSSDRPSAPGKSMSSSRICWPCGKLKKASIHYRLI